MFTLKEESMRLARNLPGWERALRLAAGIGMVVAGVMLTLPWWRHGLLIGGGVMIGMTALTGFCPACALAGRRLRKASQ